MSQRSVTEHVRGYATAKVRADGAAAIAKDHRQALLQMLPREEEAILRADGGLEYHLDEPVSDGKKEYQKITIQNRRSTTLNEDMAEGMLRSKGLWDRVVIEVIDFDKVARLVATGELSQEEFDSLVKTRETKALVLK